MSKGFGLTSKILSGIAAAGAIGGTGYGGYKIGEKRGATKAVDKMTVAFSEANQRENRNIINSFKAFNEKENMDILRRGFQMGVKYKDMNKQAALKEIYDAAFQEELEKIALSGAGAGMITKGLKTIGKSFTRLRKGADQAVRHGQRVVTGGPKGRVSAAKGLGKSLLSTAKNSKAAIGTVAAGGYIAS